MVHVSGDIHGTIDWNKVFLFLSNPHNYGKGDTFVIAGDFGCIWDEKINT